MNRTLGALGALALATTAFGLSAVAVADSRPASGAPEGDLQVWAMGTEGDNLGVLADAFMEEFPDVNVEVTAVPWDAAHERLVTAIAAGDVPDVSMIGTTWMGEFATMGGLAPTPESIDPAQFFEGAWNTTVVDGVSYGVPWYVETRLVYYRTDLAEEGGFNQAPASWEELTQLAQATVDGGAEYGISLQPGGAGRVADVHAVLLAGRRRDRRRGEQLHPRLGGMCRGDGVLRLVLRGGSRPADSFRPAGRGAVRRRLCRIVHQRPVDDRPRHRRRCRPGDVDRRPPADEPSPVRRSSAGATSPSSSSPTTRLPDGRSSSTCPAPRCRSPGTRR